MRPPEPDESSPASKAPATKSPFKDRLAALVQRYGPVALATYFLIFLLSLAAFSLAIQVGLSEPISRRFGISLEGASGAGGTLFIAWAATKALQVPRILATLALTPLVARIPFVARRLQRRGPPGLEG